MPDRISPVSVPTPGLPADRANPLRAAARKLEASFLAEMLKAARFGEPRKSFGGGIGEEQFASYLRVEVARKVVEAGGTGFSEQLFQAMKARYGDEAEG